MRIQQSKVPLDVRRRAANHLESLRTSDIGYNPEDLYLGDDVVPIYRPDIKDPAYYEFPLLKATRERPGGRQDLVDDIAKASTLDEGGYSKVYESPGFPGRDRGAPTRPGAPQGFISVATGDHDFPVPHWSLDQPPVSTYLEDEARKGDKQVERVYKLDALAYVAEAANGEEVANVGEPPYLVQDAPEDLSSFAGKIASAIPDDLVRSEAPDVPKMRGKALTRRGPRPPDVKLDRAKSWGALKKEYRKSFGPKLKELRNKAKRVWKVETAIHDYGEGIEVGQTHHVLLLERDFSVKVSGEAAEHVKPRIVKRPGGIPSIELSCTDPKLGREASFTLHITYSRGRNEEELKFFVFTPDIPTRNPHLAELG